MNQQPLKIALVMPHEWAWRSVMETPARDHLVSQPNVIFQFLTPVAEHAERLAKLNAPHLRWAHLERPVPADQARLRSIPSRTLGFVHQQLNRTLFKNRAGFENLFFRFNHYHQFLIHADKLKMSPERKAMEIRDGNYADVKYGQPFPHNWWMFRLLYDFHYATWQHNNQYVEAFFQQFQPDRVVIVYPQNPKVKPYSIAARRYQVPVLGIIGSWDNPTTKGHICAGMQRLGVQSQAMKQEMIRHHGVSAEKIEVVGWPQMDFYHQPKQDRATFFQTLGLDPNRRLLLFGAYPTRHGKHEPSIARYIIRQIKAGVYGDHCTLLIRPHPRDTEWETRFGVLHDAPDVIVHAPDTGHLDFLANLIHHADLLISHASTLALDAAGLDTCMINIAFDGDLQVPESESVRRYYDSNHYAAITRSGGTQVVESYQALDQAIMTYLHAPETDQAGRARLRQEQLEPFDGHSSQRLVELMMRPLTYQKPIHYPFWPPEKP